jgi:hypothetical protein
MNSETIGVTVTYREPVTFHLRMIGIAEEEKLRQKMFGLTEEEKAEKSYQNNVDMLADLSTQMPKGMFPNKPENVSDADDTIYAEDFNIPILAVKAFFAEKTVIKERIAEYAVRGYFIKLQPDVNFS